MNMLVLPPKDFDVVIAGARCAGAATALLLARAGMRVLVVDRDDYGADTLSTHALMRTGAAVLHRWGVLDKLIAAGTPPVRRTTFVYGDETIDIDIKPGDGISALYAPRRYLLDRLLVDAAVAAGAWVRHGITLTDLVRDARGRVAGVVLRDRNGTLEAVRAALVIGADGRQSTVAKLVGASVLAGSSATSAGVFGYFPNIGNRGYRWYFRSDAHVAAIPTNGNEHCICAIAPRTRYAESFAGRASEGLLAMVRAMDIELAEAVAAGIQDVRLRRWTGAPGHLRECHGPGWALVGDAGYFKDPLTAHGITDALRDAVLLSEAVMRGGPAAMARYQETRDRLSRPLFEVTGAIAGFNWTLDRLKILHADLNAAMKAEHAFMMQKNAPSRQIAC
jgi:menaquinone-9 beta-reductase